MKRWARLSYRYCSKNVSGYRRHPRSLTWASLFHLQRASLEIYLNIYMQRGCLIGNRATRQQTNSRQSSRGLDNSRTSQLADSEFFKIITILYCTLNLTLTITVTLSNTDSV